MVCGGVHWLHAPALIRQLNETRAYKINGKAPAAAIQAKQLMRVRRPTVWLGRRKRSTGARDIDHPLYMEESEIMRSNYQ